MGATELAPSPRSYHNQDKPLQVKPLQIQVQKLALELKQQKEQAQLVRGPGSWAGGGFGERGRAREGPTCPWALLGQEKRKLEKELEQTKAAVQQLEAQLEVLHKSCLVKLASSSWVGRMLRSSTGSVEVRPPAPPPCPRPPSPVCPDLSSCWGALACWGSPPCLRLPRTVA